MSRTSDPATDRSELAGRIRSALGASAAVVARRTPVAAGGAVEYTVVARDAVDGAACPGVGYLLAVTPTLQGIAAAAEPIEVAAGDTKDVLVDAYFPGAKALFGIGVHGHDDDPTGLVIVSRGDDGPADASALLEFTPELRALVETSGHEHELSTPDATALGFRLEASEERYRRFIGLTSESIWCVEPPAPLTADEDARDYAADLGDARFVEANHTFARRFGFSSASDVIGMRAGDLPGFWLTSDPANAATLARHSFTVRDLEVAEHDPNGHSRVLSSSLFGIHDSRGLRSVWAIERDVTSKVDEDRLLRENAEFYRAISRTALDGICVVDEHLEVLDANDALLELIGAAPGVVPSEAPILPVDPDEDRATWFGRMVDAGIWRGEARLRRLDGTLLPVELACRVTHVGPRRFYCFVQDLSERVASEQREEEHSQELAHAARLSALGEMTSGLAHELNQPLAAIVNYANGCVRMLDQDGFDRAIVRRALQAVVEQSRRASDIIQRMRRFARRDSDRREPIELSSVLREAVDMTSQALRKAKIQVGLELGAEDDVVIVDAIQIEQVILNLIRNAIEAFARSSTLEDRRLDISTHTVDPMDGASRAASFVQVSVEDTGPGVAEDVVGHVFDPFYSSGSQGIGLGLTVATSIVESHGGRLWHEPTDRGARFCFTIPLRNGPMSA